MTDESGPPSEAGPLFPPATPHFSVGARIRTWFFTGLVVAGPLAVTSWLFFWFIDTVDQWVRPLVPPTLWPDTYLPIRVPGTGVVLAFFGLTMLGFLAANLAGRTLIGLGETLLDRMPVVRGVYKSIKQIFETVFSQSGTSFRRVGLVQYPAKGMWSLVFISSPPGGAVSEALPEHELVSVFLPCAPNPTTGFFFYLPAQEVIEISLTPEQAAKIIMSAGLIQPEVQSSLAALAAEGRARKEGDRAAA